MRGKRHVRCSEPVLARIRRRTTPSRQGRTRCQIASVIIGAGVGGITLALLLRQRGIAPSAEQSAELHEVGVLGHLPRGQRDERAAEGALMLGDDPPVLADDDAVGVGVDVGLPAPDRARAHRIAVVVEPHEAGLRHRGRQRVESVEADAIRNELRTLVLERLPDRLSALLGVSVRLGPDDTSVDKPGVQLAVALDPQPRREERSITGLTQQSAMPKHASHSCKVKRANCAARSRINAVCGSFSCWRGIQSG